MKPVPVADGSLIAAAQRFAGAQVHTVSSRVLVYESGCQLLADRMPARDRARLECAVVNAETWLRGFVARRRQEMA